MNEIPPTAPKAVPLHVRLLSAMKSLTDPQAEVLASLVQAVATVVAGLLALTGTILTVIYASG